MTCWWLACLVLVVASCSGRELVRDKRLHRLPDDFSHWEKLAGFDIANSSIPVVKYRSRLTGLTVALARGETPIVNG